MGRTKVAMHSQLPPFLVYLFFYRILAISRHQEAAPQMHTGGSVVYMKLDFLAARQVCWKALSFTGELFSFFMKTLLSAAAQMLSLIHI